MQSVFKCTMSGMAVKRGRLGLLVGHDDLGNIAISWIGGNWGPVVIEVAVGAVAIGSSICVGEAVVVSIGVWAGIGEWSSGGVCWGRVQSR